MTTRRPSSVSATTSWPGTNGKLTMGSNHRDERPSTVARSLPQMPDIRGNSLCQPGPGSSGGSYVHQAERAVAATGARFPLGGDARHGEARHRAFDLKGLHDSLRPLGALFWLITGPKGSSARL